MSCAVFTVVFIGPLVTLDADVKMLTSASENFASTSPEGEGFREKEVT